MCKASGEMGMQCHNTHGCICIHISTDSRVASADIHTYEVCSSCLEAYGFASNVLQNIDVCSVCQREDGRPIRLCLFHVLPLDKRCYWGQPILLLPQGNCVNTLAACTDSWSILLHIASSYHKQDIVAVKETSPSCTCWHWLF